MKIMYNIVTGLLIGSGVYLVFILLLLFISEPSKADIIKQVLVILALNGVTWWLCWKEYKKHKNKGVK